MEGNNSFEKGLHRSNSPQMQPEGSYVDAYNWIRNDSGRLTNEKLQEIVQSFPNDSYTYLGSCPIQDSFILFFNVSGTASEIGIFDNTTKQYRTVFNDSLTNPSYLLNFTKEIDSVARINSYGEIVVYFVEEDNPVRRFNITAFENLAPAQYSSALYNTVNDWNLQLGFKMPYGEYSLSSGGSLPSGTYSFAYRYVTDQNNKTTFSIPSRFINIPAQVNINQGTNQFLYNDETLGGDPQTLTNLSLKIKFKNIDDNYPLIEIVVITYIGTINSLSIRSLGTYENILNKEIIFSSDSQYIGDQISEKELLEMPVFINSAKCIEQKDNILILSNIKTKKFDKDFQTVANNIELNWSIDKLSVDNRRNFNGAYTYGNVYLTTSDFQFASDSCTLVKVYNNKIENKTLPIVFLDNEDVTFFAPLTGYSGIIIDNINDVCNIQCWLGNQALQVGNPSLLGTSPYRFCVTSDTIVGGTISTIDWSPHAGNTKLPIPPPVTITQDVATRTLVISMSDANNNVITVTKTITYRLSRFRKVNTYERPRVRITPTTDFFQQNSISYDTDLVISKSIVLNATLNLTNSINLTSPYPTVSYKWKKNGTDITGALGVFSINFNSTYTTSLTVPYTDFLGYVTTDNTYTIEVNVSYSYQQVPSLPQINFPNGQITSNTNPNNANSPNIIINNVKYNNLPIIPNTQNVDETNFSQANVYADPFLLKGFQRGEIYSFSITPIYKDGSVGFAYHIPGKPFDSNKPNRLIQWASSEDYTQGYTSSNLTGKIKHHRMPDYDQTGYIGDTNYINVLRVTATNINFTPDQLNNIQGYIIGYEPRINDLTKSIVDTGFSKPYVYNQNTTHEYQDSLLDGSVQYFPNPLGTSSGWNPAYNKTYSMYYSADTMLSPGKLKTSYNIQQLGYITNYIVMKDPQYGNDKSVFYSPIIPGVTNYRNTRLTRENISFSDASIYGSEYILSRFPYLLYNNGLANPTVTFKFFIELNNWINGVGNTGQKGIKTQIQFVNWLDDVGGGTQMGVVPNLPKSIVGPTSAYTHLETAAPYLTGSRTLMIIARHPGENTSGKPAAQYYSRFYYEYAKTGVYDPLINTNVESSQGCGDPRYCFVRITNDNQSLYGKLENANYTPCAVEFDDNPGLNTSVVLEGDTYISKIFRMLVNKNDSMGVVGRAYEIFLEHDILGHYTESKNNYSLRHTPVNAVSFFPNKKEIHKQSGTGGLLDEPWWAEAIFYNQQYSAIENNKKTFSKPLFFTEVSEFTNRSIYSKQSFESELTDQYRIFPSLNFHDIPKDRGVITDTFVFNNNFYHHTEYGLWLSFFNPNTTQTTSLGQVVLGNPGVFQLPSKLVLDIKGGYMGTLDKSGTNTPFGRVFLDHKQGKVFLFAGEAPEEISDLGLFSFFREFVNTNDKYCMGYDWVNKRLLLSNKTQEKVISFYPKTKTWTSFHDFSPYAYFTTNGYTYAFKQIFIKGTGLIGGFYDLDNATGIRKNSYITMIENTAPDSFKRFDKMEINTMSGGDQGIYSPGSVDPNNYIFNDKSFTNIHCWTDRQNTTDLPLFYSPTHDFNTYFLASYDPSKVPVNYYKGSFHLELPLDAVVDPYLVNNTDIYADFRAHMKGKFLYTKLSYNDDKPLVLNYVKTFFKSTVA